MRGIETLYSVANRWEYDNNDNLSTRHYLLRFEEASRQFQHITGLSDSLAGPRRVRHVLFHNTIQEANEFIIYSAACFDGPYILTVVHQMRRCTDDETIASAIDGYTPKEVAIKKLRHRYKNNHIAAPSWLKLNSLSPEPFSLNLPGYEFLRSNFPITHRSTVGMADLEVDGRAGDGFVMGCVSEAMRHLLHKTSLSADLFSCENLALVTTELKISWFMPLKLGDMTEIVGVPVDVDEKTFYTRHHMFELKSQRPAVICDLSAQTMERDKRKFVLLGTQFREAVREHLIIS